MKILNLLHVIKSSMDVAWMERNVILYTGVEKVNFSYNFSSHTLFHILWYTWQTEETCNNKLTKQIKLHHYSYFFFFCEKLAMFWDYISFRDPKSNVPPVYCKNSKINMRNCTKCFTWSFIRCCTRFKRHILVRKK